MWNLRLSSKKIHMRKSWFTESQIVGILKELKAGVKVAMLCRKYGVSSAALYDWCNLQLN